MVKNMKTIGNLHNILTGIERQKQKTRFSDRLLPYDSQDTNVTYERIETPQSQGWKVIEISIHDPVKNGRTPKHWHRSLEFILPKINGTECIMAGKTYDIQPGEFLLINSRCVHELRNLSMNDSYLGYAVQLKYSYLCTYINDFDDIEFDCSFKEDREKIIDLLNMIVYTDQAEDTTRNIRVQYLLDQLLMILLSKHSHKRRFGCEDIRSERLLSIMTYLDEHSNEEFNAVETADHLHISYGYMAHLFKEELQMTMNDYLNTVRVNKAEELLRYSSDSIAAVSEKLGFSSLRSFIREFRKRNDLTPSQFRNKYSRK